ncbi:MAG: Gfo/Idh/MocA family oxidoreductase [Bacteroidota bacterium]
MKHLLFCIWWTICLLGTFFISSIMTAQSTPPIRLAVVGLSHTHVHWILGRADRGDIQIVGIAEPDTALARRYALQHGFSMDIVYSDATEMLDRCKPQVVTAFNPIDEHLETVALCAPRGIHVMVEKPLATTFADAKEMARLAKEHNIHLLTNYETTWYASNHRAYELVHKEQAIGPLRKIVVHDGHQGPKEIGVNQEFLDWLTDPVKNGGGAVTDFGCYGANLITWLMEGKRPTAVFALTQTIKPDVYPKVDDEATILLSYPQCQGIIQASWNWPFSRKDMEVYGRDGYVMADNRSQLRLRTEEKSPDAVFELGERPAPLDDPFAYFAGVVRGDIQPKPYDLSSLENNLLVMEILDAAIRSAQSGQAIQLSTPE